MITKDAVDTLVLASPSVSCSMWWLFSMHEPQSLWSNNETPDNILIFFTLQSSLLVTQIIKRYFDADAIHLDMVTYKCACMYIHVYI